MIADGYTGRKGKGGFYRLDTQRAATVKEAIDLKTGEYRAGEQAARSTASMPRRRRPARAGRASRTSGGRYAWRVLSETAGLRGVAGAGDRRRHRRRRSAPCGSATTGSAGPFELIDRLGAGWFAERLTAERHARCRRCWRSAAEAGGFYAVEDGKLQYLGTDGDITPTSCARRGRAAAGRRQARGKPIAKNGSAALWDIGDGVACLEFHSKMNALDDDIAGADRSTSRSIMSAKACKALVIHNEGENFSVGANIGLALFAANVAPVADDRGPDRPGPAGL